MTETPSAVWLGLALSSCVLWTHPAHAELTVASPAAEVSVPFPGGVPAMEVQVVLALVIDERGHVESALVSSRLPTDAPRAFDTAAIDAVRPVPFTPSVRDGRPFRSRVEYVVVFHPSLTPSASPSPQSVIAQPPPAAKSSVVGEQDEDYALTIEIRGQSWSSPRGIGDLRIKRDALDAAPHQQTSEMLSAAPGFFVDHEDGEGLGNDVYLRGFDLDHGAGIEMRVGNVPINSPVHVQGQGYADANFIIPEVVRSIRVLEGPYDPRQGDAAIVGSAYFDLGVSERRHALKASYGSFGQARLVGIAAPAGFDEQTFVAFSLRKGQGFGARRASESAAINAQYGLDLGKDSHLRLLTTAYGARAELPGVLREEDVAAERIGFYDRYPFFSAAQRVQSSRVLVSADFDTVTPFGAHFELAPWAMWTDFSARQNFTGSILSSAINPEAAGGVGDLWETSNRESAVGLVSRLHVRSRRLARFLELSLEPGVNMRLGHTAQSKSLIDQRTLAAWDRRLHAELQTTDVGAYLDAGLRFWGKARLSGGVRADLLSVSVDNRLGYDVPAAFAMPGVLPGSTRATQGVAISPRLTAEYDFAPELTAVAAYGEGFRSLQATANSAASSGISGDGQSIGEGARPYSKVRSYELGLRARTPGERFSATCSAFQAHVDNELVFEAASGGLTTQGASIRRGVVASVLARPRSWLLASLAATMSEATFTRQAPGASHFVPGIPPLLLRADVSLQGAVGRVRGQALSGRFGLGYTFLAGRHLTDQLVGPTDHVLNAHAALRRGPVELGVEGYNLLDLQYADDRQHYVSNWSLQPGIALASPATHVSAAPPLTLLGTLGILF